MSELKTKVIFNNPEDIQNSGYVIENPYATTQTFNTEDGKIESIKELEPYNLLPVYSNSEILYALEVNRGWFATNDVNVGDKILNL